MSKPAFSSWSLRSWKIELSSEVSLKFFYIRIWKACLTFVFFDIYISIKETSGLDQALEGLSLLPKMYRICGIPRPLNRLAPQTPVEGLSLLPKMYRICSIPRPLKRLAPQTPVEGLSLLPKMYRILWNFILRFWTRKILNSLRFAQGFALSSAQLELKSCTPKLFLWRILTSALLMARKI